MSFKCKIKEKKFIRVAAKSDRLKQAKAEAEKEIKAYKQQREEAYQKRISDVSKFCFTCLT